MTTRLASGRAEIDGNNRPSRFLVGSAIRLVGLTVLLGPLCLYLFLDRFQPVESRATDYLWTSVIGLGLAAAYVFRPSILRMSSEPHSRRRIPSLSRISGIATVAIIWTATFFATVNGLLDTGPSVSYAGIVTSIFCSKGSYSVIQGAPFLPASGNSIKLHGLGCGGEGRVGDSVTIQVKQGFLHRPWVVSFRVHSIQDKSRRPSSASPPEPRREIAKLLAAAYQPLLRLKGRGKPVA